jgi:hypothetical protein
MLLELHNPADFRDDEECARCHLLGKDHRPPKSFAYSKSNYSSGGAHEVPILARTCCWSHPLTTCVAFCREVAA